MKLMWKSKNTRTLPKVHYETDVTPLKSQKFTERSIMKLKWNPLKSQELYRKVHYETDVKHLPDITADDFSFQVLFRGELLHSKHCIRLLSQRETSRDADQA